MLFNPQVSSVIDRVDALCQSVDDAWQIPREEAQLLSQIVRIGQCVSICEVGVSYGFSTLHLTAAVRGNLGHHHGFDISPKKVDAATKHLTEAGLMGSATLHLGDARELLKSFTPPVPYDFLFIDASKDQSRDYLDAAYPKLGSRCIIVTDNTATHADELAGFVSHLRTLPNCTSCHVPIGNGFELTVKHA